MKDTDYTYAVARIRVNEARLIGSHAFGSLIAASYGEIVRRLREYGYEIEGEAYAPALERRLASCWELLQEILPDTAQFNSILIKNDFQNLKVCLKALLTGKSTEGLFAAPSVYDPEALRAHVFNRENDLLPEPLRHADRSAYRILTKTGFAQLSDTVIDRAAMEHAIAFARRADHPVMLELASAEAALTALKVLYRCILTGKETSFMERAVAENDLLSKHALIAAAAAGMDAFTDFVAHSPLAGAGEALAAGPAVFEKFADDYRMRLLLPCKSEAFGIGALAGYYYAVRTEVLDLRILLSGKLNALPDESIRERMRLLYV